MFFQQKFQIGDEEEFSTSRFPQLDISLKEVRAQLAAGPAGPKAEMISSFVKNHCISSQQVQDYPELAKRISSKSLPLHVMEALFEAGRQNVAFTKKLEDYVTTCLNR